MAVHPSPGHAGGTVANALVATFPQASDVGDERRPGIVHRLDKDTSGLMLVALSDRGRHSLQRQIASRTVQRRYIDLATGRVLAQSATVAPPIGRDPRDRKRLATHRVVSREARTSFQLIEQLDGFALLEARLHTGRTHQIRVHLAAIGHPIAGDSVYGGASLPGLGRQFLHARSLLVRRPSDNREQEFISPLPFDLSKILADLGSTALRGLASDN